MKQFLAFAVGAGAFYALSASKVSVPMIPVGFPDSKVLPDGFGMLGNFVNATAYGLLGILLSKRL